MVQQKWQFKLASQERCERLKRSFGGWRTIMPYLRPAEQVSLQGLDHWTYDTGVPRAQINMKVRKVCYFLTDDATGRFDSLDVPSNRARNYTFDKGANVHGFVQTRMGIVVVSWDKTFLLTKSKDSDELLKAPRKDLPVQSRLDFALTAFGESHVVYTGGVNQGVRELIKDTQFFNYARVKTTLFYKFETDKWKQGPDMNEARYLHSSCSLGDYTYVIAVCDQAFTRQNSIERLNAKKSIPEWATWFFDWTHQWELVQVSGATLKPCTEPLVCQLNDQELLILGGEGNERRALALHHESLELRLLSDGLSMPVTARQNQCVKLYSNKVLARVKKEDSNDLYVITYTLEEPNAIQIVKQVGIKYQPRQLHDKKQIDLGRE